MSTDVTMPPDLNAAALLSGMADNLQYQVAETVKSTGRAVTASAEAMQESVETITENSVAWQNLASFRRGKMQLLYCPEPLSV